MTTPSTGCLRRRKAEPMGAIEWGILFPAFLAGILVLATHVPLGQQVLTRGIVFIDLAIAQVAGLGVTAADAFGFEPQGDRKSTRLNSSHQIISYAVFFLKQKT